MNINILSEDQLAQLSQLISHAQTILVTCHKSPDGDALGSMLAWGEYLRSIGKEAVMIVPDQYPDFLLWLPNTEKIVRYDKHREKCDMLFKIADLVFCLDYIRPSVNGLMLFSAILLSIGSLPSVTYFVSCS